MKRAIAREALTRLAVATLSPLGRFSGRLRTTLGGSRRKQFDLVYGLDWGDTTTNNYGFAPSQLDSPERFQLQMYDSLCEMLEKRGWAGPGRVLEISCGRAGGLAHLARRLRATFTVGLFVLSPIAKQITASAAEHGPTAPQTLALIDRILLIARFDIAVLLLVVVDMVTKPFA